MKNFIKDERGATSIEYGLIALLLTVVLGVGGLIVAALIKFVF